MLGNGKGTWWASTAATDLRDPHPQPSYRVVGETHPRVLEREGEAYRSGLIAQTQELGIASMVSFEGRYLDLPELLGIVRSADVVLLPYDSRDQVTSGVLTEATAAGVSSSRRALRRTSLLIGVHLHRSAIRGHRGGPAPPPHRAGPCRADGGDGPAAGAGAAVVGRGGISTSPWAMRSWRHRTRVCPWALCPSHEGPRSLRHISRR